MAMFREGATRAGSETDACPQELSVTVEFDYHYEDKPGGTVAHVSVSMGIDGDTEPCGSLCVPQPIWFRFMDLLATADHPFVKSVAKFGGQVR